MADLEGELNIRLCRVDGGLEAQIRSSRRVSASRVFVGKGVYETAAALPALFSICRVAQACACAAACEAALGLPQDPDVLRSRHLLVEAETVKEHLWRLLLDWPRFLGEMPEAAAMRRVIAAYDGFRAALLRGRDLFRPGASDAGADVGAAAQCLEQMAATTRERVLALLPDTWLGEVEGADDLIDWSRAGETPAQRLMGQVLDRGWAAVGQSRVGPLPPLSASDLEGPLGGTDVVEFLSAPSWGGAPAETSPYSRNRGDAVVTGLTARFGNGLLPRLGARLVEVAALQGDLRNRLSGAVAALPAPAAVTGPGVGIAQVAAARGLLVHRIATDGDRILDYRILAPTEWNFHPGGVVAQGLATLPPADDADLRVQAGLLVTAVDPCVGYDVDIR